MPLLLPTPYTRAYGKMAIKDAEWENPTGTKDPDGIVVVRIPRRVSPFTAQARDWYFPQSADATAKDWDVEGWLKAFAGEGRICTYCCRSSWNDSCIE